MTRTTHVRADFDSYGDLGPEYRSEFSDVVAELDAAASAGMKTVQCVRPGVEGSRSAEDGHPRVRSFDGVLAP